jgi:hypothetical protein
VVDFARYRFYCIYLYCVHIDMYIYVSARTHTRARVCVSCHIRVTSESWSGNVRVIYPSRIFPSHFRVISESFRPSHISRASRGAPRPGGRAASESHISESHISESHISESRTHRSYTNRVACVCVRAHTHTHTNIHTHTNKQTNKQTNARAHTHSIGTAPEGRVDGSLPNYNLPNGQVSLSLSISLSLSLFLSLTLSPFSPSLPPSLPSSFSISAHLQPA